MAIVEVKVPQLSESVAEATMLQWKKKAGDAVAVDEILIEIETDKVVLEVPAPSAGVLAEILVGDGGTVVADQLTGGLIEFLPDGVALTGGPEGEQAEAGESHAVVGAFAETDLGGDRAGDDFDDVRAVEGQFTGGAIIFPEGEGGVAGFVGAGDLAGHGGHGAVRGKGTKVEFEEGLGLV